MIRPARLLLQGSMALAALAVAGCAHAPPSSQDRAGEAAEARPAAPVQITGSRLSQRVDARGGLAATTSPVRIYSREDLDRTGAGPNLRAALSRLDPSF